MQSADCILSPMQSADCAGSQIACNIYKTVSTDYSTTYRSDIVDLHVHDCTNVLAVHMIMSVCSHCRSDQSFEKRA